MTAISALSRHMRTGIEEKKERDAVILDNRTAVLEDGTRLRITPEGQKKVDELIYPGDIIKTNYGTGGRVIAVSGHSCYGLPIFTITYVDVKAKPNKDGSYRENDYNWINENVAQDGRILKLFEMNKGEITVLEHGQRQLSMRSFF